MNDKPSREREPELKEVHISLEHIANKNGDLINQIKNKINMIYRTSEPEEPNSKLGGPVSDEAISLINEQIRRLQSHSDELERILKNLDRII